MIKRLELENWRSHHRTQFEFGKGTNVLVGIIGAGKSSVVDAICFALFGTFPARNSRRVSLEETIMAKPNEMDSATVRLIFEYAGKDYVVERTIKRKGANESKLKCGAQILAGPKMNDVTEKVEELLSVNYELFSRAVYAEQNQLDIFIKMDAKERKEKFDELLGLERYETARSNAVSAGNKLKKIAEETERKVKGEEERLKQFSPESQKKKIVEKAGQRAEIEKELHNYSEKFDNMEKTVSELERDERDFRNLRENKVKLSAKKDALIRNISDLEKKLGKKSVSEIKTGIAEIKGEFDAIAKRQENAEKDISKTRENISEKKAEKLKNLAREKEIGEVLPHLKGAHAECPVCKTELDKTKKEKLLAENEKEREKLKIRNSEIDEKCRLLEKEIMEINSAKLKLEREKDLLMRKNAELNELVLSAESMDSKAKELLSLDDEIKKTEKGIELLKFDEAKLNEARKELYGMKSKKDSMQKEILSIDELIAELRRGIENFEKGAKEIEGQRERIAKIRHSQEQLAIFTNALAAAQAELRNAMVENVNMAMDDVWQRIYPYADYTSAKMIVSPEGYEITVRNRKNEWVDVDGVLSGGERSAAALAMRISFALVLTQNLSWLVLDEPTHNLDSRTVESLSKMLREHLPQLVEQVFIITHDKQLEDAASCSLYVLERDKNSDSATRISEKENLQ